MKNWKDKVLGIFAGIGLMSLLMGNYALQPKGVWEMHFSNYASGDGRPYAINSETGEVRKYSRAGINEKGSGEFVTTYEVEAVPDRSGKKE